MNQMLLQWLNTRDPYVQYCHIDKLPAFREWFRRQLSLLDSTSADDSETSSYLAQCEALSVGKTKTEGSFSAALIMPAKKERERHEVFKRNNSRRLHLQEALRSKNSGNENLLLDPQLLLQEGVMMQELPDVFPEEEDFDEEWYEEDQDEDNQTKKERETCLKANDQRPLNNS